MAIPKIARFTYNGTERLAVAVRPAAGGTLHVQMLPDRAFRTFALDTVNDYRPLRGLERLYWFCKYKWGVTK